MILRNVYRYNIIVLIVCIMVMALSCSDTITGGRGITLQQVALLATETTCPHSFNSHMYQPGNRTLVTFTEVSGAFACTTWTNDSSKAVVQLIPGKYIVTVETGRGYGVQEMLDTLWVIPGDFTVVGSSDWYPTVPRLQDQDSMIVIHAFGAYEEPDLIIASYYYSNPSDSLGIEVEQGYIELLNEKIGGYLVTDSMQRSIFDESMSIDWMAVYYSIPTTKELFVWRIKQAIGSVRTQFPEDFPPDSIWTVQPPPALCLFD